MENMWYFCGVMWVSCAMISTCSKCNIEKLAMVYADIQSVLMVYAVNWNNLFPSAELSEKKLQNLFFPGTSIVIRHIQGIWCQPLANSAWSLKVMISHEKGNGQTAGIHWLANIV